MNRKNTILVAVLVNAALLAVLFIAAFTMQEDLPKETLALKEEKEAFLQVSPMEEAPVYQEIASLVPLAPPAPAVEEPVLVHRLPPQLVTEPAAPPAAPPAAVVAVPVLPPLPMQEVVVKKGDTLDKLAKAHRTTIDEIVKLNHLPGTSLKIGQLLKVPTGGSQVVAAKPLEKKPLETSSEYYTMKVGENPWAIAQRHHMKVEDLLKLNGLNEEKARKLKPGDRLRVKPK